MNQTRYFTRALFWAALWIAILSPAIAAPRLQQGAIVNAASFAVDGTPSAGIARGSLFTVFGVDLGPTVAVQANSFPLPVNLGGVSIKITAGGNQYDAVVLFALNSQVSAILPSAVPAGQASLVLTFNGQASNAITFQVVNRQVGVFTRTQNGGGLAVLQNFISPNNQPVNTINQSAQPGQVVILWGTGLGASLNGDDRNAPAPGNVAPLNEVKVYVGGKEAVVEYAGRSGCCSGVDQINFRIPTGVEGCFVPVVVTTNGIPSNFTSIAIANGGSTCRDPYGLSSNQIDSLLTKSSIRVGAISLSRSRTQIDNPFLSFINTNDVGVASFTEYATTGLLEAPGVVGNPILVTGSCMVSTFRNDEVDETPLPPELDALYRQRGLDAGAVINVNGPKGARQLTKDANAVGEYFASLSNPLVPQDTFLDPGSYTISNGSGGADVKAFSVTRNVPSLFTWTNRNAISAVNRSQSLTVTWTPGNNPDDVAAIFGTSYSIPKRVASVVFCFAPANAGTFTIPQYVLAAMVPSDTTGSSAGTPGGSLSVGAYSALTGFTAEGLDVGAFVVSSTDIKFMNFQ
ncbi:MAG: hypothetical protein MUF01_03785 [Bryobacterales bacterium]|jgi:uncharacterized protein (TIGR03437 family)|nr:hypothetical protein [Bryobacterales bacterium]